MKMTLNNILFVLACLAILIVFAGVSKAKAVNVCVSLTLPASGKCIYKTVRGYKVRVCKP